MVSESEGQVAKAGESVCCRGLPDLSALWRRSGALLCCGKVIPTGRAALPAAPAASSIATHGAHPAQPPPGGSRGVS